MQPKLLYLLIEFEIIHIFYFYTYNRILDLYFNEKRESQ